MQGESRSQVYLDYAEPQPIFVQASAIELAHIAERSRKSQSKFSCKRAQSRTIALSQMSKIEFTRILPWRAIALLRTCSGYAERSRKCQEKVHLYERLCKARAEAKFTWIMPSRSQMCIYMKGFSPRFFCPRISLIYTNNKAFR